MDFYLREPSLFDPKCYSYMLRVLPCAVRLECVWQIVWVNGPFQAGAWSDLLIARLPTWKIMSFMWLMEDTMMETNQCAVTPTGHNNPN